VTWPLSLSSAICHLFHPKRPAHPRRNLNSPVMPFSKIPGYKNVAPANARAGKEIPSTLFALAITRWNLPPFKIINQWKLWRHKSLLHSLSPMQTIVQSPIDGCRRDKPVHYAAGAAAGLSLTPSLPDSDLSPSSLYTPSVEEPVPHPLTRICLLSASFREKLLSQ